MSKQNPAPTTTKEVLFEDEKTGEVSSVFVAEHVDPTYGMYLWPSAPVLAQFIWHHRALVCNKTVVEIGAGSSLPGILAAKLGARVTLTDGAHLPHCLDNCKRSVELNDLSSAAVAITPMTWGKFTVDLMSLRPVDIILASDCFYDTKDFEDILASVAYLIEGEAELWLTYQVRSEQRSIDHLLLKWGLIASVVPLRRFGGDSVDIGGSGMPGCHSIELYIIKRKPD